MAFSGCGQESAHVLLEVDDTDSPILFLMEGQY